MRWNLILSLLLLVSYKQLMAQTWQSINYTQFSNTVPSGQFIINQYSNDIWMINDNKVAVIENNGVVKLFDYNDLGTLWTGDHLRFTFTPDSIFYMLNTIGLMNFNNYTSSEILLESNISDITSNKDTVYISRMGTLLKYVDGNITDTYFSAPNITVKNEFLYTDNGYLGKQNGFSNQMLIADPQYLLAPLNDKRFRRFNDTIFAGTTKGIMYAFNYDILDTITPNNTTNMPSPNVLEIEFDDNDSLWAVFGDINDVPFSIAKLEGDSWTNIFDNSNSPINFSNFNGLEIDTLGNLWVADNIALHTFLTPNSPSWLGTIELDKQLSSVIVYPNPSTGVIHFDLDENSTATTIEITDLSGRLLKSMTYSTQIELNFKAGQYFIRLLDGISILGVEKIVIE
jgi:hypothetical protein